ncbi:MAG: DUF4194 domain-containing protein [Rhodoglobus sp.]
MSDAPTTDAATSDSQTPTGLWHGDLGELSEPSRRALLDLIQGPYLSGARRPKLWAALLADSTAIQSRLNDLFLDLVIDRVDEFAFVRPATSDQIQVPVAVRSASLTFMDTLMLLVLRQILLASHGERRVFVGKDEVYEQLRTYRIDSDETGFDSRMNSSWTKLMNRLGVIHSTGSDDRVEISPVLKLLVDDDRVRALTAEYRRIVAEGGSLEQSEVQP